MADRAAVIFVGTVIGIKKPSDNTMRDSAAASVVEVDFTVERAVHGATVGTPYALREWAGMWRDSPRFTLGQRLLMLLHAPGPGGLSSPIDGLDGAIPVRGNGVLPATGALSTQATQSADDSAGSDTVDMRWLQARTLKTQTIADSPTATPGVTVAGGLTGGTVVAADPIVSTAQSTALGDTVQTPTSDGLAHVLGLLTSWQATRSATH